METERRTWAGTIDLVKLVPKGEREPVLLMRRAADLCGTLRFAIADTCDGLMVPVPFPRTACEHAAHLLEECADHGSATLGTVLTDGDLLQLAELANWLDADALSECMCSYLAELLVQCGSPDVVRDRFRVECDMTSDERRGSLTEVPWFPAATTAHPSLEVDGKYLTSDAVENVLNRCSPPALLWLKGVSRKWRDCIRETLCAPVWAQQHGGLAADWASRSIALTERAGRDFTELLSQRELNLSFWQMRDYGTTAVAAVVVFSTALTNLNLMNNEALHTAHYILRTTYCALHTSHYILHTTYFALHTAHYILHTTYYTRHTAHYILHTTYCTLHTAHYILRRSVMRVPRRSARRSKSAQT